jgi:hypothetical protein
MRQRKTAGRRRAAVAAFIVCAALGMVLLPGAAANNPVTGAAFTSVNEGVDGTGHCKNGNPNNNCNIYDGKEFVWLNGGPSTAYVGDGDYFFAVLDPGGQADPNDGSAKNLSSPHDDYTDRTFSVSGATVSYPGPHDFDSNKIRLMPYDDTSNPGGVYILAICSLADGYPVNASDCKYDAFKIQEGEVEHGLPLTTSKDADGGYDKTFVWTISKEADKTTVQQAGGNVTFTYTVKVTHDGGTVSGINVSGTISVFNPNVDDSDNTVPVDINGVTDGLSDGTHRDRRRRADTNAVPDRLPVLLRPRQHSRGGVGQHRQRHLGRAVPQQRGDSRGWFGRLHLQRHLLHGEQDRRVRERVRFVCRQSRKRMCRRCEPEVVHVPADDRGAARLPLVRQHGDLYDN